MNWSGILGLAFAALLLAVALLLGGTAGFFYSTSTLILVLGIPLALALATFGVRDYVRLGPLLRVLLVTMDPEDIRPRHIIMVRSLIPYTYAAGIISMLLGTITMLANLDDPSRIGEGMAVSMLAPLYALLIAELWLRPALRQLEHLAQQAGKVRLPDSRQSTLSDLAAPVATLALVMFILLQFFVLLLTFSTLAE